MVKFPIISSMAAAVISVASVTVAPVAYAANPVPQNLTLTDAQCRGLTSTSYAEGGKFPNFGDLADAPTQLTSAKVAPARPKIPSYCEVEGYIAPQIGFHLRLPMSNWNGKFYQQGCGGMCGTIFAGEGCNAAVSAGYACVVTDMGHRSTQIDTKWVIGNPQGMIDFSWRATHLATVAGKAITEYVYGHKPYKAYFNGCSTGGRQALAQVQKFPEDYDGVIANAPATGMDAALQLLWSIQVNYRKDGSQILSHADIDKLSAAVMKQCDGRDGLVDGIINNPGDCRPDLTKLGFTAEQQSVIQKIYDGPRDSKGRRWTEGTVPGTEDRWKGDFIGTGKGPSATEMFMRDWFRRIGFGTDPGANWQITDFDWDRDPPRVRNAEAFLSVWNPDISNFTDRGGKLILLQGWVDNVIVPGPMIRYYENVAKMSGGYKQAGEHTRLFMIGGAYHCWRGPGADAIDVIDAIEDWVEKGQAPDKLIGYHPKTPSPSPVYVMPMAEDEIAFSRPYFPWPASTKYSGKGDPNKAESFVAVYPAKKR